MKKITLLLILALSANASFGQTLSNKKDGKWQFTLVKRSDVNPVQDQNRSGTCWCFSTLSFFESELMRMGKGKVNLSEMYVVNRAYRDKADMYVRMHGAFNFGPGGAFHDPKYVFAKYGVVPEEVYYGDAIGEGKVIHNEMDEALSSYVKTVVKAPNGKITSVWKDIFNQMIDGYLGKLPESFTFQGKQYTPKSYAESLGLNMNDYVEISSFTHHPFYSKFIIELPDNWQLDQVYNVPLEDFRRVIDNAVNNGYTVAWATDVSEKGFSHKNGVAVLPEGGWDDVVKADSLINTPHKQAKVTQEMRQKAFDNYETQDDHGMHITGMVKDQLGQNFYIVKNSWGLRNNECDGYLYASEAYVLMKSTCVMVHKSAIPKDIASRLGL